VPFTHLAIVPLAGGATGLPFAPSGASASRGAFHDQAVAERIRAAKDALGLP
jgi:hypothetical protein